MSENVIGSTKAIVLNHNKSVQRGTYFVLKAVPKDNTDFSPKESMRKIGDLAFHLATLPLGSYLFTKGIIKEFIVDDLEKAITKKLGNLSDSRDYASIFQKSNEYFLDFYENLSNDDWINKTYTSPVNPKPVTYLQGFLSNQSHILQHRGTLFAYLRVLDIPVTMKQYFGMQGLE